MIKMEIHSRKAPSNDPFMGMDLGDEVVDRITGFTGVVMAKIQYLTGCDQMQVQPKAESSMKLNDSLWFDVERLQLLSSGVVKVKAPTARAGADLPHPPARDKP
jgi:hypothetical protein